MRNLLICTVLVAIFTFSSVENANGQGIQTPQASQPQTHQFPPRPQPTTRFQLPTQKSLVREAAPATSFQAKQTAATSQKAAAKPKKPWTLSSRIHLEKGTNQGYLVVQMDLAEGHHVYSLNPQGSPAPTRLAVLPSNDLKVTSKFVSAKAPLVIEKDPVFGQRIEKHKGQVQFFAPIQVRAGVELKSLTQEVQFSGQVCSQNGCQPIRELTSSAEFAGYFEIPKSGNSTSSDRQQLK